MTNPKISQAEEQALRFMRVFTLALVPQLVAEIATGKATDWHVLLAVLVSLVPGAGETAWRAVFPTVRADHYLTPVDAHYVHQVVSGAHERIDTLMDRMEGYETTPAPMTAQQAIDAGAVEATPVAADAGRYDDHGNPIPHPEPFTAS